MGEMADYLINGDDCEWCGKIMGNGPGYPRLCDGCEQEKKRDEAKQKIKDDMV